MADQTAFVSQIESYNFRQKVCALLETNFKEVRCAFGKTNLHITILSSFLQHIRLTNKYEHQRYAEIDYQLLSAIDGLNRLLYVYVLT